MRLIGNVIMTSLGLFLLALAGSFAASNDSLVSISVWPLDLQLRMPVWLVGLGGFGLGLVFGGMAMSMPLIASKWQQGRLRRQISTLEKKQTTSQNENVSSTPKLPKA